MAPRVIAGQVVVIAGGGLGIGALAARAVAGAGAEAIVAQRGAGAGLVPGAVGQGRIVLADVEALGPTELCEVTAEGTGRVDALLYCAAPALVSPYWQLDDAAWQRGVLDPLQDAHAWLRAAMLQMRQQRHGTIVVVGPAAGLEPNDDRVALNTLGGAFRGLVEALAYAGLRSNVQCYALRLGARAVEPGAPAESVWPELGPRLLSILGGRTDAASGGTVDITSARSPAA